MRSSLLLLFALMHIVVLGAQERQESVVCSAVQPTRVEVRVYNKAGEPLKFRIKRVTLEDTDVDENKRSSIQAQLAPYQLKAAQMNVLHVFLAMPMLRYRLTIGTDINSEETRVVDVFHQCVQRVDVTSINISDAVSYGQTSHESLVGFVTGCSFRDDWWVRVVRILDEPTDPRAAQSFVSSINDTGEFALAGHFYTGRYAFIFGRGGVTVDVHTRTVHVRNWMAKVGEFSVKCGDSTQAALSN